MKFKKKTVLIVVVAALVLIPAGTAFAYWTVGGNGTGTATTGTSADITVNQTSVVTGIAPGAAEQTLSGTFTNTSDSGSAYVATVTASIASVTKSGGAPTGSCDATDYTLSNAVMTVDAEVPAGSDVGAWTGATVQFNDKATNQDGCQGATVNFAYTIGSD